MAFDQAISVSTLYSFADCWNFGSTSVNIYSGYQHTINSDVIRIRARLRLSELRTERVVIDLAMTSPDVEWLRRWKTARSSDAMRCVAEA